MHNGVQFGNIPADSPIAKMCIHFNAFDRIGGLEVVQRMLNLRSISLCYKYCGGGGLDEAEDVYRTVIASRAGRFRLACAPEDAASAASYGELARRPPLAWLISILAENLGDPLHLRHLVVEAEAIDLVGASAALAKLRKACEPIGMRLEIEAVDS